ncbi:IS3 family transposase [Streptosporangium canum]|uniref:IS3 family transposase n=1 Tax=Streptosporangium canum TaxID=324952 RepID=UPI0037BAD8D4
MRDGHLAARITEIHRHSRGTYGAPRIHAVVQREGAGCGRRRVTPGGGPGRRRSPAHRAGRPSRGAVRCGTERPSGGR